MTLKRTTTITLSEADVMQMKGWLSAMEVSRRIHKHISNVYRAIRKNELQGMRVGSHWYVSISSLMKYLGPAAAMFDIAKAKR
jgi:hypothetical protein